MSDSGHGESSLARRRRENRERYPCGIEGCGRTAHKGRLCRAHYSLVPYRDRMGLAIEVMTAAHEVASAGHARQFEHVAALEREAFGPPGMLRAAG